MNIIAFDEIPPETHLARGEALGRELSIRRPLSRAVQGSAATRQLWPVFSTHAVHSELCVLQTPEVYLPYPPLVDGKGYRLFDVYGPESWIDYVRGLESALAARLRRWNDGRAFLSAVKDGGGDGNSRVRFKHVRRAALWSYEERPCEWSDILCHQPLWILFVVRGVWATDAHWGVSFDVVQIQKREPTWTMRPFFRRPASSAVEEPQAQKTGGLPEPYATMVKRGVPLPAVHHKMRLDGLDPGAFSNTTGSATASSPAPTAPVGPAALFAALRGGVALRAAPPKEDTRPPPAPHNDKLPRISLDEILRIKARLGKNHIREKQ